MIGDESAGLRSVSDIYEYFDILTALKEKMNYLIIVAIKDTSGGEFSEDMFSKMSQLGFETNLVGKYRRSYIGIADTSGVIYEELGAKGKPLDASLFMGGCRVFIASRTYTNGDDVLIAVDGIDYAVGKRGLNIVTIDKRNMEILDSVCFDTHTIYATCYRNSGYAAPRNWLQSQLRIIENNIVKKIELLENHIAEQDAILKTLLDAMGNKSKND